MMTQSMQQFEDALDKFREGDPDFFNSFYWANTCPTCSHGKFMNCGRGHASLQMMERLMYSQPVELEVG